MTLRKPLKIDEAKFQQFIRRGTAATAAVRQVTRTSVLIRIDPDILEQFDAILRKQRFNRNEAIGDLMQQLISGDITLRGPSLPGPSLGK
jgi:hypothetical protein